MDETRSGNKTKFMDIVWPVNPFFVSKEINWIFLRDIASIDSIHYHDITIFVENLTLYKVDIKWNDTKSNAEALLLFGKLYHVRIGCNIL